MEIFEILKENSQADLDTKINLIENNFFKKENDFELDAEVGCKAWKMFQGQKKTSIQKLSPCFCVLMIP